MQTRPCPQCSEIIPADVDYCPFCGQSTRETIHTEEDIALAESKELKEPPPPDSTSEEGGKLPPVAGTFVCLMCHTQPATAGDYCADCKERLDMGPEQWDLMKQDEQRRKMMIVAAIVLAMIVLISLLISHFHRHRVAQLPPPRASAPINPAVLTGANTPHIMSS